MRKICFVFALIVAIFLGGLFVNAASTIPLEKYTGTLYSISYGNHIYVTVGDSGIVRVSDDSIKWKTIKTPTDKNLYGICFDGVKFLAVGETGVMASSEDGNKWTLLKSAVTNDLYSVKWCRGIYVAAGKDGTIISSKDGYNWDRIKLTLKVTPESPLELKSYILKDIAFNDNIILICGEENINYTGIILSSKDGVDWKRTGIMINLNGRIFPRDCTKLGKIIWDGNNFYALGYGPNRGVGAISSDGETWATFSSPLNMAIKKDNTDYFLKNEGKSLITFKLENKELHKISECSDIGGFINDITCENGDVVAVGAENTILTTKDFVTWKTESFNIKNSDDSSNKVQNDAKKPNDIKILINGKLLSTDVKAFNSNGRILVPTRAIFEEIGGQVEWDDSTKTVNIKKGAYSLKIQLNNTKAFVGSKEVTLDVPAQIINSRMLIPLRFIAESIGANVEWNDAERLVTVTL